MATVMRERSRTASPGRDQNIPKQNSRTSGKKSGASSENGAAVWSESATRSPHSCRCTSRPLAAKSSGTGSSATGREVVEAGVVVPQDLAFGVVREGHGQE